MSSYALVAMVAAACGMIAGWALRAPGSAAWEQAPRRDAGEPETHPDEGEADGPPSDDATTSSTEDPAAQARARSPAGAVSRGDGGAARAATASSSDCMRRLTSCEAETARVARELAAHRADEQEERGEPIAVPDALPPRFEGGAIRAAVSGALEEARAEGRVEDLDCSEYPCIAFGRLRGDEEDMERVERSRALAIYRDDVLTMLFWAQSDDSAPRERPRETGLFALAFYTRRDRGAYGDRLDRRVRIRTVELWNTIQPGW